jgi:hypothetical protein
MHLVKHRFRGFVDRILEQRKAKRNVVQLNFDLNEIMSLSKEDRMNPCFGGSELVYREKHWLHHNLFDPRYQILMSLTNA